MKKPSLIIRFFSFLFKILVVLILMVVIAVASFEGVTYYLTGSLYNLKKAVEEESVVSGGGDEKTDADDTKIDEKNIKNVLFFVDRKEDGKQYISLNMLNTETYAMDILLVPLNAQVTVGSNLLSEIQKKMPEAGGSLNLNEISRIYEDEKYDMICNIFEYVTGLKISGYDVMSEDNFVKFLNMAGPVTYHFDNNISYRDEKGVLQNIEEGDQELDGRKAMALISYLDGTDSQESDRLERASTYLESFVDGLFQGNKSSAILKKYTNLAESSKDRDFTDAEKIVSNLDSNGVTIRIMQGAESDGVFTIDSQKAKLQIAALAKQAENYSVSGGGRASGDQEDDDSSGSTESSKDYTIELYNAAYVSGLAGEWEAYLEGEGYNISLIDSYQDEGPISTTRIIVTKEGIGEDLLRYFPDAVIKTGEIDTGGDIKVYIGTDSTNVEGSSDENSNQDEDTSEDSSEEESDLGEDSEEDSGESVPYSFDTDSE